MTKIVTPSTDELNGRLEVLRIFKDEALERMAENDRVIDAQKARIAELQYHLGRCRDSAYQVCFATAGVLPADYVPNAPAKKAKGKT